MRRKIGLAIPCFNNLDVLQQSLPTVYSDEFLVVLFDDGSSDGTQEWVKANYPAAVVLRGDGEHWWTGSLEKAISYCLARGCDYIVSINADVLISPTTVHQLLEVSRAHENAIVASLVVDINNPEEILWAGSFFKRVHALVPIYSHQYVMKAGNSIKKLPSSPYLVDEVHGRGVLLPRTALEVVGNYDGERFPHYGGDNDFSFRAKRCGVKMLVDPESIASVYTDNTSLGVKSNSSLWGRFKSLRNYLFVRKNGEALYVWWSLYQRYLPVQYFFQSFVFIIALNIYRRMRG